MAQDNQPKHRQAKKLRRKTKSKNSFDRILIVTEGSKTEPNYFNEIRKYHRLPTANVLAIPSAYGTDPLNIVNYAEHLFLNGDAHLKIPPRAFEDVYAVFDRDEHATYHNAIEKMMGLDGRLRNDLKQAVSFNVIASIPNFELWLLLHYTNIQHPLSRQETLQRLKHEDCIHGYDKGMQGVFELTKNRLEDAMTRSKALTQENTIYADGPFTNVHELVKKLIKLRG